MTTQQDELLALLVLIYVEVMDYPPVQPMSTDSYLPERLRNLIRDRIAIASGVPVEEAIKLVVAL